MEDELVLTALNLLLCDRTVKSELHDLQSEKPTPVIICSLSTKHSKYLQTLTRQTY